MLSVYSCTGFNKNAEAKNAAMRLIQPENLIHLQIMDDGIGFSYN